MIKNNKQGFTLIEILIVVAIIAILASIVLVGLGPTQQSGRDARRLSDLHEVQNGLELFYNKCGYYPGRDPDSAVPCNPQATGGYADMSAALIEAGLNITTVPVDPTNATPYQYGFRTNGATASQYILFAQLENQNSSVFNSYTPLTTTQTSVYTSGDSIGSGCGRPNYCITL